MTDVTVGIAAQNRGEYAPGTMPRYMAEVTAGYVALLANHASMAGEHATWLIGAQELILSLLHCLDLANVEIDSVTPAGTSPRWLSPTLAGKLANLAHFNRLNRNDVRAGQVYESTAQRLDGLGADPELLEWATKIYREQGATVVDWAAWKQHLIVCADCTAGDYCPAGKEILVVDWAAWKQHLIVCADCTAGDYCPAGKEILGDSSGDDAPWLRNIPR